MTKAELINEIAISSGYDKKTINIIVDSFLDHVVDTVSKGETIYLRGFGSFGTKVRAAKVARNINKQISISVPAHTVPAFKPYPEFMEKVR